MLYKFNLNSKCHVMALIVTLSILPFFCYSQNDSLFNVQKKIAEEHCLGGQGNGTFKITLAQLEKIFSEKYNTDALLKVLPKHTCEVNVSFSYNEKTKNSDLPQYEYTYAYLNPVGIEVIATVEKRVINPIKLIVVQNISGITYDNILNALPKSGYIYRASISSGFEKHFFNKGKNLIVILKRNRNGDFSIEIG